jgi:hypothetical protein
MTNRRRIVGPLLPIPAKHLGAGAAAAGTTHAGTLAAAQARLDAVDARHQIGDGVDYVVRARLQHPPAGPFAPDLPFSLIEHKFSTKAAANAYGSRPFHSPAVAKSPSIWGSSPVHNSPRVGAIRPMGGSPNVRGAPFPAAGSRQFKPELVNNSSGFRRLGLVFESHS